MNRVPSLPARGPDQRYQSLEHTLEQRLAAGLYRRLVPRDADPDGPPTWISLCSNDYLGLAADPRVIAGAKAAADRWGAGGGSARLIAGELGCYGQLEEALADFLGHESALVFNSGYHANLGLLQTLPGPGGRTFSDALNHASIIDGCRLGRSAVSVYPHNDLDALARQLSGPTDQPAVVVTEGMFSMDGDLAPVAALRRLAVSAGALLMVDDAHAIGVLGDGGRGIAWAGAPGGGADVVVGTFGKALGSAGAFVAGPRIVREALINVARTFIFTTAPSPAAIGAAAAALEIVRADPEPRAALEANVRLMRDGLAAAGFDLGSSIGHIIPLVVGTAERAARFAQRLIEAGIYVRAIRPPTVPEGTCRLRLTVSAAHRPDALARAVEIIARVGRSL
jgi:8-amino-7-oxononanoate synthase